MQFNVPSEKFEKVLGENLVVHHMSEGDNIRVRVVSDTKPWENAVSVTPNLEDAYLWLLRRKPDNGNKNLA